MKEKRCIILIDGSNFFYKLKDLNLHNLLQFDFSGFAKMLSKDQKTINSSYYVGAVRTDGTKKTQQMLGNQQKLLAHLKNNGFNYVLGYLLKSDGDWHEKGVDVNIAVDILVATYENICDRIILVSSDTDLLPAIKKAREKGKIIEYIGFSHARSYGMINNCSNYHLLKREDLVPFTTQLKP